MTKAADNLIPGGALDWDDVDYCTGCSLGHAPGELTMTGNETEEGEPELLCDPCMLKAPEESILALWLS